MLDVNMSVVLSSENRHMCSAPMRWLSGNEEEGEKAMPHDDEGLMEFYLDEMLNDEQSGAMIELVRPIGGNHAALFSRLRACYATFLYTAETEQNPTTVLLRQRQVQERKQLVQRREALERQEALKDQSKNYACIHVYTSDALRTSYRLMS